MYTVIDTNSAVYLREYDKIFLGTNQEGGYENPVLGFTGGTKKLICKEDAITYFHYPTTTTALNISATNLILAGAVAGSCPHYADKVWKKQADYSQHTNWGDASPVQNGQWLCTWLSGNMFDPSVKPVWKDRWYNPGYIDTSMAWIANPASDVLVDLDSSLEFEPGVLYRYYHVGDTRNLERVNSLSGDLHVHFDSWTMIPSGSLTVVEDELDSGNYGTINVDTTNMYSEFSVNKIDYPDDASLKINGNGQNVRVFYNPDYTTTDKATISFWAYALDWNDIKGEHLVSNNLRGGWTVRFSNGFSTPFYSLIDRFGKMMIAGDEGKIVTTKDLPGSSRPIVVSVGEDRYTWILDDGTYEDEKSLYKVDYNGDIVARKKFDTTVQFLSNLDFTDGYIWVSTNTEASAFRLFDVELSGTVTHASVYSSFATDINGNLSGSTYNKMLFDNSNTPWYIDTAGLYYSTSLVISSEVCDFACDKDDNVWATVNDTDFYKLSSTGDFLLSGSFSDCTTGNRGVYLTESYEDDNYVDYVWFTRECSQVLYKYTMDGVRARTFNLQPYDQFYPTAGNNSSGYDRDRRLEYLAYNRQPYIFADVYVDIGDYIQRYTLSVPTSTLAQSYWHMFSLTYDTSANNIKFYTNSILQDEQTIPSGSKIYYEYENPLYIGANAGRISTLGKEVKSTLPYFAGYIDDLRIYSSVLNISDIRSTYFLKYDYKDLNWNMPVGRQNFLEEIERFFKFKLPGQKAQYYNIKVVGLDITDPSVRSDIETIIRDTVKKIAPAYTELLNIIWE